MYASIMDLEAVVLFLKEYLRNGTSDVHSMDNPYRVFRFTFADGEQWNSEEAEIHIVWAQKLCKAKILDVSVPDIDQDTQYQQGFYCLFPDFTALWTLKVFEKAAPELIVSDPDKRYLCEYSEERLPLGFVCDEIFDPSIKLMDAVQMIEKIALGKSLRYNDFCGGPEHITDRLNAIDAAFRNGAECFRSERYPRLVASAPPNVRNLYAAADSARWFLNAMDTRNENLPGNLYDVCGNAFDELRLQMNRAYRYVLKQL